MKIKYNKILPFKPYLAIMLFGTIYTRSKEPLSPQVINHEEIHEAQAKDNIFGYVGYYLHYIALYILYTILMFKRCPFENEAYANMNNLDYLKTRLKNDYRKYV